MGRLRKVSHKDVPLVPSLESADSQHDMFVPNDFADDCSNPMSLEISSDDGGLDKALFDFYMDHRLKRSTDLPVCSTFTRNSGKFFSGVVDGLRPRYEDVIENYGMGCLLSFVRTELKRKFIPLTKYDIHGILDLPVDGEPLVCDPESGRDFILSHFNLTSIPPVSFFANKLKSLEVEFPDEDVFICFMIVAFASFLCPNSSLCPSPKYLHIFRDCRSVCTYDLSQFVYEWLLSSIKKFKDSTKVASKRSVTFGGCHSAFAVSYLDHLNFGLHSISDAKPWILAWRGNKGSVQKSSASKSLDVDASDVPFATRVQSSIGARLGSEARHQEKPKIFVEWSESIIADVLNCSKSVSIQSAIPNTKCAIFDDNSVREVHPHGPNLPSLVTPVIPVVDGGIHNPVVLAGSTTPKLCDEVWSREAAGRDRLMSSGQWSENLTDIHWKSIK
uniref:Aminotransferase-like plant mobile domain-containing protein n=1 Tax=Aegilops tauschii TaxID=37682 RepID=M8BN76_AEGTA